MQRDPNPPKTLLPTSSICMVALKSCMLVRIFPICKDGVKERAVACGNTKTIKRVEQGQGERKAQEAGKQAQAGVGESVTR